MYSGAQGYAQALQSYCRPRDVLGQVVLSATVKGS